MRKIFEVAIFVLATSRWFQMESSWDSRVLQIQNTWGRHIGHLYFVFGTNVYDYKFLRQNCRVVERYGDVDPNDPSIIDPGVDQNLFKNSNSNLNPKNVFASATYSSMNGGRRYLVASSPQTVLANRTVLFSCSDQLSITPPHQTPTHVSTSTLPTNVKNYNRNENPPSFINALWTANCTGEYFGFGPTCRCQESLRYMQNQLHSKFRGVEWFIFMDDDVYIRPHSIAAMLNQFSSFNFNHGKELALLYNATGYRGLKFSGLARAATSKYDCKIENIHSFSIAMPVILNRKALETLAPAIEANGMTELRSYWGGTHDAILGLLLWLYQIDTYTLHSIYYEAISDKYALTTENIQRIDKSTTLFVHRVKNMMIYPKIVRNTTIPKKRPSQGDMCAYFGDNSIDEEAANRRGKQLATKLIKLVDSGVRKTSFADRAAEMKSLRKFHTFRIEDCKLL